jgi:uncharacterized protein YndB with AHSA1/START domain
MTLIHDTISLRRKLTAPVARVFDAWRDTAQLEAWCSPGDESWTGRVEVNEFSVGGIKRIVFGPAGQAPYVEESRYLDIVPESHIINSERILAGDGALLSVSVITLEFVGNGAGCELHVTDQITMLAAGDTVDQRRDGWGEVLDKLVQFVRG